MGFRVMSVFAALLIGNAAAAHHSAAMFDTSKEITFDGVVTRYDWKNPHVYMTVRTAGPDGAEREQEIEAGAASVLQPLGLAKESLHPGDRVTVHANPSRRGEGHIVLGREIVTADGSVLPLFIASRSIKAPSAERAKGLAGTWLAPRDGFFAFTSSVRGGPLTEAGKKALADFDVSDATHARCIPVTAPTLMLYPVVRTIEVDDDTIVFNVDWMSSKRAVYMDGRGHPENGQRTLHGHSIGHWEGNTLVIDTVDFADHREGNALGLPSGPRKHLVERLSLTQDARHINYKVALEDPDYLEKPVEFYSQWEYRPDLAPTNLECDPGVAKRYLTDE
ncbi:MAG TPA: DUF6152 family protein [Gammaproteobacteria bacterium]|nr:DUF6152 family protein [Gammaproteobacteria bacterium]